ncbi:MAG: histidine kinase [Kineosporiaceae bacterium]
MSIPPAELPPDMAGAGWTALRSTSMPLEIVAEPVPATDAGFDAQLLELFFDRGPMGVAVFGTDMRLIRCNQTWVGFCEHYFGVGPDDTAPGRHLYELIPGNEEILRPLIENALAGRVVRQAAHRVASPIVETYWDVVFAPLFENGEVVGVVDIITDATDRVLAFRGLEARIGAFTRIAAASAVDQPLAVTLREVVAALRDSVDVAAASIVSWADGAPTVLDDGAFGAGYAAALAALWAELGVADRPERELPRIAVRPGYRSAVAGEPALAGVQPYWASVAWEDLVAVPLTSGGHAFGELQVHLHPGRPLREDEQAFLVALADQAAVAAQNASLFSATVQNATLLERQRLARELHDSVSQALFSMTLHARAAQRHLEDGGAGPASAAREVERLRELTGGALAEMRALIFELRPGALAEEGLVAALGKQTAALAARTATPVRVHASAERLELAPDVEEHLYRLVLEALNNALKHADADSIDVDLRVESDVLVVAVRDDGRGFDPGQEHPGHLGLHTMRDRAAAVGGRLDVTSAPREGTAVVVTLPYVIRPRTG